MAVQYDFYKNPSPKDSQKPVRSHARVVPYGTVDTNKLAQRIHSRCTVTPADVKAVLSSLSDVVIEELKDGNRIHIEGLGYRQITLECPPIQSYEGNKGGIDTFQVGCFSVRSRVEETS